MKRVLTWVLLAVLVLGTAWAGAPVRAAEKKLIAITYDDGPSIYTPQLLDGLKARGAKATFFMVGNRVSSYLSTVERVYQEGHQVANHSYDHSDLTGLSAAGIKNQITSTSYQLDKVCGSGTSYMVRAPYGSVNSTVFQAVGAPLVLWSVDPVDWLYRNAETVKNNIIRNAHDGAVILVHDIHPTSIPGSLAAIDYLQKQGYEFVTVRELFRRRGITMQNGVQYNKCAPNGADLGPVEKPAISCTVENGKIRVTITAQKGASIYYTTGTGKLNQGSTKYTGPFLVSTPCTVRAVAAFNMNGSRSETVEQTFSIPAVKSPGLRLSEGMLTIECKTAGAAIYYSLSGAQDSEGDRLYTEPVAIEPGTEISAYAEREGYLPSERVRASYSSRGNFFLDVFPGSWYYESMDRAASQGLMKGVEIGEFAPEDRVTRGQLITLLYRYAGEEAGGTAPESLPFADVDLNEYYAKSIAWAYENGIVKGVSEDAFQPNRGITREEMAQMVFGFLRHTGMADETDSGASIGTYTDADKISDWARTAVGCMTSTGLLRGDEKGAFLPKDGSTRAEAAAVLIRLSDLS